MKIIDCHDLAMKGEPTFTLLARDRTAPKTITTWADGRRTILCQEASARLRDVITDTNIDLFAKDGSLDDRERAELDKINAAYAIAQSMELWRGGEVDAAAKENREVSWRRTPRRMAMSPALGAPYTTGYMKADGKAVPVHGETVNPYEAVAASVLEPKKADNFENESPVRAFTDFQVSGRYAVGKGFRPSLSHLAHYLDAMLERESWELLQIILPEHDAQDPTLVFQRVKPVVLTMNGLVTDAPDPVMPELRKKAAADDLGAPHDCPLLVKVKSNAGKEYSASGLYTDGRWFLITRMDLGQVTRKEPLRGVPDAWAFEGQDEWHTRDALAKPSADNMPLPTTDDVVVKIRELAKLNKPLARTILTEFNCIDVTDLVNKPEVHEKALSTVKNALAVERQLSAADEGEPVPEVTSDDPLRPAHYGGTQCMEIIEHMPTNVGLAVKYLWRLGQKDAPRQELGKAIEYLRRELRMARDPRNRWSVFGINPEDVADYRNRVDRYTMERFGADDWRQTTVIMLMHYTVGGQSDCVDSAINDIEIALSEMHDHGHGLAI